MTQQEEAQVQQSTQEEQEIARKRQELEERRRQLAEKRRQLEESRVKRQANVSFKAFCDLVLLGKWKKRRSSKKRGRNWKKGRDCLP
jgi:hypothetical protein